MEVERRQRWMRRASRSEGRGTLQIAEGQRALRREGEDEEEEFEEDEDYGEETVADAADEEEEVDKAEVSEEAQGEVDKRMMRMRMMKMKIYNERKAAEKVPDDIKHVESEGEASEEAQMSEGKGEEQDVEGMQIYEENEVVTEEEEEEEEPAEEEEEQYLAEELAQEEVEQAEEEEELTEEEKELEKEKEEEGNLEEEEQELAEEEEELAEEEKELEKEKEEEGNLEEEEQELAEEEEEQELAQEDDNLAGEEEPAVEEYLTEEEEVTDEEEEEEPTDEEHEPLNDKSRPGAVDLNGSVELFEAKGHKEELDIFVYAQGQRGQGDPGCCHPLAEGFHRDFRSVENRISMAPTAQKDSSSDENGTLTFWMTENDQGKWEEEEGTSTGDAGETDERSTEGDLDDEEDVVKAYSRESHASDMFGTLTEFRESSILTDLTLCAHDGNIFPAHSPVLAAVSSLVENRLKERDVERGRGGGGQDGGVDTEAQRWSLCLEPEVDLVGLRAVLEFAYTGAIVGLNRDTAAQIQAAAQTLGVPRVLDLCAELQVKKDMDEEGSDDGVRAAEQLKISIKCIKELWMKKVGCDVIFDPCGDSLHAHRVILAASSDYFRGMFTSGMRESHQPRVALPFLLTSDLEALIGSSYCGMLHLSWGMIFEITVVSLQLQYEPSLSLCLSFLLGEINPHSCLDVVSFAEAFEMADVLEAANDFVLRQFQKVSRTSKFKDLPAKQLLKYLNSWSLYVPSELVVFKAVVAWIQAKPKIRLKLANVLMQTINFPLMTFKEFKEVQGMNIWSNYDLSELYDAIFEDFCSSKRQCRVYLPKESLILVGGDQITEDLSSRSASGDIWFGNSMRNHMGIRKVMEWRKLGVIPETPRFGHEVAVLKGQLYVIGGRSYYGIEDLLNTVYRYDPSNNSWERLADMLEQRSSFSVVVLDEKLYAIGGNCGPCNVETVECYCPSTNTWSFTQLLNTSLKGHVARVLHNQIYISGGLNGRLECLASLFLYHPKAGSTYLADMTKPRAQHCMETLGGLLYVAGGISKNQVNMTVIDVLACEVYSPTNNSWTAFASLPVPHVGAGSVVLEGRFYVLGGYSHEDYYDIKMAHRYDSTTQKWENMGRMPGPNNDLRAALLCLPSNLRLQSM